jgi:hypothetical protein
MQLSKSGHMKTRYIVLLLQAVFFFSGGLRAQENPSNTAGQEVVFRPTSVVQAVYFDQTPPLREMNQIRPSKVTGEDEVENRINPRYGIYGHHPFLFPEDPAWQKQDALSVPIISAPIQNFEGINNISGVYPPDTQGDVSADKYVQVVNLNFAVYSKTGTLLLGPSALSTIWAGIPAPWNGTNNGDPVVLFDQAAQRWIISQFSLPAGNYAELVAISQTSDPTGSWYRYVFQFGNQMPDYPKFGIWPDGYYLSVNQFTGGSSWGGTGVAALDRSKMLLGDATATMQYINLGTAADPWSMLPSDWDGTTTPVSGEPNYFTYYNDWSSATVQYLKIYSFHVDWTTPSNTTFTQTSSLSTLAFDSELCTATRGRCIPQPGTSIKLESLSDRLMYRLQYRNFGSYRAMVTNHTVDVDGTGHAGIRWYELRNSGSGWSIYQQGTYSPDASHRWVGSIAMNSLGDIALGYSVSDGSSTYPSIRYTARRASDPLGQMTLAEQTIMTGTGSQTGSACRWGDYSMMSVDPTDDLTFWFTTEYILTTGPAPWRTRIASFRLPMLPVVTTLAASSVTTTSATLNGTVNPNGLATTYYFQWGTTTAYGNNTTVTSAGSGSTSQNVSAGISGLANNTLYHFRITATNSDGTSYGSDLTFTTSCPAAGPAGPITGPVTACQGGTGYVYTVAPILNATGYSWTLPVGGTITAGANTNTITVSYGANAVPGYVIVYGLGLCGNGSPSQLLVTVNAAPTPAISGPASACAGATGKVYTTEPGMTGYAWAVTGGTITAGAGTNSVTVTWTTAGAQTISVNYNNAAGCPAVNATTYNVAVNALPTPTITGAATICQGLTTTYTTQTGQSSYVWTVSAGGQITSGQGTASVNVKWNSAGAQSVAVNYANSNGCTAAAPVSYPVTVNTAPVPTITGTTSLCATSGYYTYTTEAGMTGYNWTVSAGGSIFAGQGTNTLTVYWSTAGSQSVSVVYNNAGGCGPVTPTVLPVTVNTTPGAAGAITGPSSVCAGQQGVAYSCAPVAGAAAYAWTLPAGATIASGANTNSITVNFAANASGGAITVSANNLCGNGPASPGFIVSVNPIPQAPGITQNGYLLTSSVTSGNQWYKDGNAIAGATAQTYTVPATEPGYYWVKVTLLGCTSGESNHVYIKGVGIGESSFGFVSIFPVPNDGRFVVTMELAAPDNVYIDVYNELSEKVYSSGIIRVNGKTEKIIDFRPASPGMYSVIFTSEKEKITRKIIVKD